jgi:molybdopterin-guanine dinucleotide biosynthesis protein A
VPEFEGFILAGGASSRMGVDKGALRLGGKSMVERAAVTLGATMPGAGRVSLVSSRADAEQFGLPVVADLYAGLGAAGGLHAALTSCRAEWAVVLACDLPFVTPALLARLISYRSAGFEAVAPVQADGRPQPLCALYSARPCAAVARALIETGELRPRVLLRETRTRWVEFAEVSDLPGSAHFFRNLNTPTEYEEARRLAGESF